MFIWGVDDRENVDQSVAVGLDGRGDGAVKAGDLLCGVFVQAAQDHNAGVVGLVAVVEDEVAAGGLTKSAPGMQEKPLVLYLPPR